VTTLGITAPPGGVDVVGVGVSAIDHLTFANASAAFKCTKVGGRPGIPTLAAAEALVAERGGIA
jgi:sugar/nucleoside kinase (ribokinase family)